MACYSPLHGYRSKERNPSGKRGLVFSSKEGLIDRRLTVPCGQCIGCRLERSRQWAVRCMHEAALHDKNCFVTLTYDEEHIPPHGSLVKADLQKFFKRLRKHYPEDKIRYFAAGEYGDGSRPHYHMCLFGFDFPDKARWSTRNGNPVFRSEKLETKVWKFGYSEIGGVSFESAAYVAKYIHKKVKGSLAKQVYAEVDEETGEMVELEREFGVMSRRPGIGRRWIEDYMCDVFPRDGVLVRGRMCKPPRYYDDYLEMVDAKSLQEVRAKRAAKSRKRDKEGENSPERLEVRKVVTEARLNLRGRSLL